MGGGRLDSLMLLKKRGKRRGEGQEEAGERKPGGYKRGRGGDQDANCPLHPSFPLCIYRALSPNDTVPPPASASH